MNFQSHEIIQPLFFPQPLPALGPSEGLIGMRPAPQPGHRPDNHSDNLGP